MLVRMWQNVKFTSFFMSTKNLHIKSFTLIPSRLFFYVKVKIYTSSLLHCYQLPMFFKESTYFLIKFFALISSFLHLYGVQFFPCLHNFVEVIKNICQVHSFINQEGLVMTRLKELGRSGNYVLWNPTCRGYEFLHSQHGWFFWNYFVIFQPKQRMFRIRRWRSSGVPIEKIRTYGYEQTLHVMYQRLTETSGNNCLSAFISCSTSCLIASWRGQGSYCSNLFDRNSAWSPSRNSKHASLWLNKDKIVSKNSSTLLRNS